MQKNIQRQSKHLLAHGGMAKKTVIKQALKYAPIKADFRRALASDETIKTQFAPDMTELNDETVWDMEAA